MSLKNTVNLESFESGGFLVPAQEINSSGNTLGVFLAPKIDFFVGTRINIVANMGSIGFSRTVRESGTNDEEIFWQFQSNISPSNIGLGIEFNF